MCKHFWIVDSKNYGRCKHCNEGKDFQPLIDKGWGISEHPKIHYMRDLNPSSEYYMQGSLAFARNYKMGDYCFRVEDNDDI